RAYLSRRRWWEALCSPSARSREARRHHGQRRHAARRYLDHSAKLVLTEARRNSQSGLPMNELYRELLTHLRGIWHRRWIGLAVAWLAVVIGIAIVYRIPERYEATARVYVDTESILRPLLAGLAIQPNLDQQVALMSRTLISRPNVEKLVRMADLDLRVRGQPERDELIDNVIKTIRLDGNITSNLYVISYRDPDSEQARRVVQSLLGI